MMHIELREEMEDFVSSVATAFPLLHSMGVCPMVLYIVPF